MEHHREMGERVAGKDEGKGGSSPFLFGGSAQPGWRYRAIGLTALIFGALGGVMGFRAGAMPQSSLTSSLLLPMIFSPYFVIPRTKTNRILQGVLAGALGGIITIAILLIVATGSYWPLRQGILITYGTLFLGSIAASWLWTVMSDWAEKKRVQLEARRAQRSKSASSLPKKTTGKKEPKTTTGKPVRVHRYNRKKRRKKPPGGND